MVHAARYASECRLAAMYFAFEDELFAPGSGVDPGTYGRVISETRAGP
jgi:hypothetical protein